jgi:hypothetical protein
MLFGDDGSMPADAAWLWVNCHDWPDWTIDVLRAVEAQAAPVPDRQLLRPEMAEDLRTMTVREDPRYALHTRGSDYDLIVIGSKGRGLMKSLHIGSTAEWLMHLPPAPTVIVRGGHKAQRILLAHDGSLHAMAAERAILTLPWAHDAEGADRLRVRWHHRWRRNRRRGWITPQGRSPGGDDLRPTSRRVAGVLPTAGHHHGRHLVMAPGPAGTGQSWDVPVGIRERSRSASRRIHRQRLSHTRSVLGTACVPPRVSHVPRSCSRCSPPGHSDSSHRPYRSGCAGRL